MSFAISTSLKATAIAGLAGVAIAVPLSLPKSNGLSIDKEVLISVDENSFEQRHGIGPETQVAQKHLPKNCRPIATHSPYFLEKRELLLCPAGPSPSLPVFYFYEIKRTEVTDSTVKVKAQKVKTVSSKLESDSNLRLLISLADGTKKELTPTFVSAWIGIENLNPETECKITDESDNKQTLYCQKNKNFEKIETWTK